mmetsp:Transcript_96136/g.286927  ORF Transcript_96136/g.286927 Transcript_96136/m.286927 type:complete len:220 (+) Transcript_96136:294-953(+)
MLEAVMAALHALGQELHACPRYDLDGAVKAFVAVLEVGGIGGFPVLDVGADPRGQHHRVWIELAGPVVGEVPPVRKDLRPEAVEDLGVHGGGQRKLVADRALQGTRQHLRHDADRRAGAQLYALVAVDAPAVAPEDAHAHGELGPDEGNLGAVGQHQGHAEEQRPGARDHRSRKSGSHRPLARSGPRRPQSVQGLGRRSRGHGRRSRSHRTRAERRPWR